MFRRMHRGVCPHGLKPAIVWKKFSFANRILQKNNNRTNNNTHSQHNLSLKYYAANLEATRWHSALLTPFSQGFISTRSSNETGWSENENSNYEKEYNEFFNERTVGFRRNYRDLYLQAWKSLCVTPSFLKILLWKYHRDGCPDHFEKSILNQSLHAHLKFNHFPTLFGGELRNDLVALQSCLTDSSDSTVNLTSTNSKFTLSSNRSYVDLDELEEKNNDHILLSLQNDTALNAGVVLFETEGGTYHGTISNGLQHGSGLMVYKNGDCYEGEWANGLMHGYGKMRYSMETGGLYEGAWVNGERCGHGIYVSNSGDRYVGNWHKNERHGLGRLFVNDELIYNGEWHNGDRQGNGIAVFSDKSVYTGEWNNGLMDGSGTFIHSIDGWQWDGLWSEGIFVDGKTSSINNANLERILNNRKENYENGQLMSWHTYQDNSPSSKKVTGSETLINLFSEIKQYQSQINNRLTIAESLLNES